MTKKLKTMGIALLCILATAFAAAPSVKAEDWYTGTFYQQAQPVLSSNPYSGGWGNCTWSAWQLTLQQTGIALPSFGSAGAWYQNAAAMGYQVSSTPKAGSIVCWSHHVGYVAAVSEDGQSVYIMEGGYGGGYHEGWFPAYTSRSAQTLFGYIWLY